MAITSSTTHRLANPCPRHSNRSSRSGRPSTQLVTALQGSDESTITAAAKHGGGDGGGGGFAPSGSLAPMAPVSGNDEDALKVFQ